MEFHIARSIRQRTKLTDTLFSYTGNVVFANLAVCRELAQQITTFRQEDGRDSEVVNAGALFAMGLIDELSHVVIAQFRVMLDPSVFTEALHWFAQQASPTALEKLLERFTTDFPNVAVFRGDVTAEQWLSENTEDRPNREVALEEILLLWLSNQNPAFAPYKELFDDTELRQSALYRNIGTGFANYFETRPRIGASEATLLDVLRASTLR